MTHQNDAARLLARRPSPLALACRRRRPRAAMQIDSFTTTSSTDSGGRPPRPHGPPSRSTNRESRRSAKNVDLQRCPRASSATPTRSPTARPPTSRSNECPSSSQVGLITIHANYEGDPNYLLGTAPIYRRRPAGDDQTALLRLHRADPRTSRSRSRSRCAPASDYGLRFTVSDITQLTPLAGAELTFWGFPADADHDAERFPKGSPGQPAGLPGLDRRRLHRGADPRRSIPIRPLTDNPTICTGEPLVTDARRPDLPGPGHLSHAESSLSGDRPAANNETFKPVLQAGPTTNEADSASGLDIDLSAPQFLGFAASPSQIRSAIVTLPDGLTINPDAADGQSACTDAQANFGTEGPGELPRQRQDRDGQRSTRRRSTAPLDRLALHRRTEAGRPVPALHDRRRLRDPRQARRLASSPDPQTGQLTVYFDDLPQVPFEEFDLHLFASDRGLMATPTQLHASTTPKLDLRPWNAAARRPARRARTSASPRAPTAAPCPGQMRPFNPRLEAGTSNPLAGAFSAFTLKLDRDDGDQFLGDLNFKMPPGLHRRPARASPTARRPRSPPPPQNSGRAEQATPSCPATQPDRHHQRRRRARRPPLPRGRQDVPGRALQGRAAQPRRDHPGPRRPLRLRRRRRPGRAPRRPADRPGQRRLRHGAVDHRRRPDPDALDPGQHRQAELHDQPDQLLRRSRSTRRGSATRARSPTSPPTSRSSTARRCPSSRR